VFEISGGGESGLLLRIKVFLFSCLVVPVIGIRVTVGITENHSADRDSVWFVGSGSVGSPGNLWLDPLLIVNRGVLRAAPSACDSDNPAFQAFAAQYMKSGQRYDVVAHGRRAGAAIINPVEGKAAGSVVLAGAAHYEGALNFGDWTSVLVTNGSVRERATAEGSWSTAEKEAAQQMAKRLFLQAGVQPSLVENVAMRRLDLFHLPKDTTTRFAASFWIDRQNEQGISHNLFVVARAKGGTYEPELVVLKVSQSETDNEQTDLIDHIDFLGDGDEEIVTETGYYENYRFTVYRQDKSRAGWRVILQTKVLGCE
jgi:hypothetical protein